MHSSKLQKYFLTALYYTTLKLSLVHARRFELRTLRLKVVCSNSNWAKRAYGAPGRTRTCNLRFRRPLLYPVELLGHFLFIALRWYNSNKLVFLVFSTFSGFSVHLHHNFFSFNFTLLQILRFCCGAPPQTRTEKMQGLSLPRLPIASVEHNDLTNNRRLYQFAYFPIMVGKAGLEPANSGSQSKEISTGSGLVRIAGFKPAISWSRIMRSSSSCPISG